MNYLVQQKKNLRKTYLLVSIFVFMMGFLGLLIDGAFDSFPIGTFVLLFIALIQILVGVSRGTLLVLRTVNATPVNEELFEHKQLKNIVEELSIAAGLKIPPKVYVMEDENINAFATGFKEEESVICVTTGLLENLNREETEGVVAHEISHILSKDTLLMTTISAILGTMVLVQLFAWRLLRSFMWYAEPRSGKSRNKRGDAGSAYIILALLLIALFATLFSFVGKITIFAVSRAREYLADAKAVELTRNPKGLSNALRKIAKVAKKKSKVKGATVATAHLFIFDPLKRDVNNKEGFLADLFSTHPPIHKRIAMLENIPEHVVLKELELS